MTHCSARGRHLATRAHRVTAFLTLIVFNTSQLAAAAPEGAWSTMRVQAGLESHTGDDLQAALSAGLEEAGQPGQPLDPRLSRRQFLATTAALLVGGFRPGEAAHRLRPQRRFLNGQEAAGLPGLLLSYLLPTDDPFYDDPFYESFAARSFVFPDVLAALARLYSGDVIGAGRIFSALARQVQQGQIITFVDTSAPATSGQIQGNAVRSGNVAWVGYGLTLSGNPAYRSTAIEMADFLLGLRDAHTGLIRGGPGATFIATEHNLDAWFFLDALARATGEARFQEAADALTKAITAHLFQGDHFDQGLDDPTLALDAQYLGAFFLLAQGYPKLAKRVRTFIDRTFWVTVTADEQTVTGYKAYASDPKFVWAEGTAFVALLDRRLGHPRRARRLERELAQVVGPHGGLRDATPRTVSSVTGDTFLDAEAVAATSLAVLEQVNPAPFLAAGLEEEPAQPAGVQLGKWVKLIEDQHGVQFWFSGSGTYAQSSWKWERVEPRTAPPASDGFFRIIIGYPPDSSATEVVSALASGLDGRLKELAAAGRSAPAPVEHAMRDLAQLRPKAGGAQPAGLEEPEKWAALKTVLVVDDEPKVLETTADIIEFFGLRTIRASNLTEARQALLDAHRSGTHIDAAIVDMDIAAKGNGLAFIRAELVPSGIPGALYTGRLQMVESELVQMQAEGLLAAWAGKPASLATLETLLRQLDAAAMTVPADAEVPAWVQRGHRLVTAYERLSVAKDVKTRLAAGDGIPVLTAVRDALDAADREQAHKAVEAVQTAWANSGSSFWADPNGPLYIPVFQQLLGQLHRVASAGAGPTAGLEEEARRDAAIAAAVKLAEAKFAIAPPTDAAPGAGLLPGFEWQGPGSISGWPGQLYRGPDGTEVVMLDELDKDGKAAIVKVILPPWPPIPGMIPEMVTSKAELDSGEHHKPVSLTADQLAAYGKVKQALWDLPLPPYHPGQQYVVAGSWLPVVPALQRQPSDRVVAIAQNVAEAMMLVTLVDLAHVPIVGIVDDENTEAAYHDVYRAIRTFTPLDKRHIIRDVIWWLEQVGALRPDVVLLTSEAVNLRTLARDVGFPETRLTTAVRRVEAYLNTLQ